MAIIVWGLSVAVPDNQNAVTNPLPENEASGSSSVRRPISLVAVTFIAVGWALFLASFFMPAIDVLEMLGEPPGARLNGWQAMVAGAQLMCVFPLIIFAEPTSALLFLAPLLNGVVLVSPMMLAYVDREDAHYVGAFLLLFWAATLLFLWILMDALYVGYYCWSTSLFLLTLGFFILSGMAHLPPQRRPQDTQLDPEIARRRAVRWSPRLRESGRQRPI